MTNTELAVWLQILQTIANGTSRGLGYIYGGRVVAGFGVGGISAVAPSFVSECAPKDVRGRITGLFQVMVATGVMLSYFINCASHPVLTLLRLQLMIFSLVQTASTCI